MVQYRLNGTITVSVYTDVEADSLEEAIEIAQDRDVEKYQWGENYQSQNVWVNEDYDGEITDIKEE